MGAVAAFLKYWKIGLVIALLIVSGAAYHLWTVNVNLRQEVRSLEDEKEQLVLARQKDALAAKQLIEAMQAEQDRLRAQLDGLAGINDEEGRAYLDAPVPDSVRRLFNQ